MNQSGVAASAEAGVEPSTGLEPSAPAIGVWIAAWAEFVLLGYLAVIGAFFASDNVSPGDYTCGLILSVASVVLAFMRLKSRFDGDTGDLGSFLLVDDLANLIAVIVVFTIVGLAGLFIAAGVEYGGLHNAGVALFVVSGIAVFLNLRRVFDNLEREA